jgi:peroxiredoxin
MDGWAKDQGIKKGDFVKFLGDTRSEVTRALGLVLDHQGPMSVLGNPRCKRFSMMIDKGVIKVLNIAHTADDPAGDDDPSSSLVEKMLADL